MKKRILERWEPKIVSVLKEGYSRKLFAKDLIAGLVVGIVALPLSIAFAIASGVKPEQGLITTIVAGFLIAFLSGSRVQIGGPTGAFVVLVYDIVQKYGYEGLALATIMAGVLLILMGFARLGDVIKFIPYPVTVGFTSGIALIIFTIQIRDLLGFTFASPEHFIDQWAVYLQNIFHLNPWSLLIGLTTILIVLFWPKSWSHIPAALVAIIASVFFVNYYHLPVETIGQRFGEVSNQFPMPHLPVMNLDLIIKLSQPALAIALLAGIESLLSAVVADGMTGRRHRSNTELIAQGVANIASPLFGGICATGAIARTATNIKLGGKTPVAGIIHSITILFIFLFLAPLAAMIPMAALAGILIVVAYTMSEWQLFLKIFRSTKSDVVVLLITFLLTIFIDLTVAIEVGVVMASFLFMRRMVEVTRVRSITETLYEEEVDDSGISNRVIPKDIQIFEIYGPFFFGAADKFRDTIRQLEKPPKILILLLRHVPTIDATGLRALEDLLNKAKKDKIIVILCGIQPQPLRILKQGRILEKLDHSNICSDLDAALTRANAILSPK